MVADISVAHCPERVLPGRIMIEMITNDRVVGGLTPRCAEKASSVYRVFAQGEISSPTRQRRDGQAGRERLSRRQHRLRQRAVADHRGAAHRRLGGDPARQPPSARQHPQPGPGVGGHCIPSIRGSSSRPHPPSPLIRTAREVNDRRPHHVAEQVIAKAQRFQKPTIGCLGLTFKANVDDVRESPAIEVVGLIAEALPDIEILISDPYVDQVPKLLAQYAKSEADRAL